MSYVERNTTGMWLLSQPEHIMCLAMRQKHFPGNVIIAVNRHQRGFFSVTQNALPDPGNKTVPMKVPLRHGSSNSSRQYSHEPEPLLRHIVARGLTQKVQSTYVFSDPIRRVRLAFGWTANGLVLFVRRQGQIYHG
jgi:hypothetical protein